MNTINNQSSVSFSGIRFVRPKNWVKNGQTLLKELDSNPALHEFVEKNPGQDVVFLSRAKKGKKHMIEFLYRIQDKGLIGSIKGLFSKGVPLAEVSIAKDHDVVKLFDETKQLSLLTRSKFEIINASEFNRLKQSQQYAQRTIDRLSN